MVEISNVRVYDLDESIVACRNAMRLQPAPMLNPCTYSDEELKASLERAKKLCKAPSNSGHANFLTGIRVSFDIKYPNYLSPELQRYHFLDIITSSSKMHTLIKMAGDPTKYNKYVTQETLDQMKRLQDSYNIACETGSPEDCYEAFMKLISNCPQGIELFMRVSTNYMQLRNIYAQRKNHKLKEDWGAFCDMIKKLPYAKEFLLVDQEQFLSLGMKKESVEKKKLCKCGTELESEHIVMCSNPPQYPYTCPKCGKRYIYQTDGTRWEW